MDFRDKFSKPLVKEKRDYSNIGMAIGGVICWYLLLKACYFIAEFMVAVIHLGGIR